MTCWAFCIPLFYYHTVNENQANETGLMWLPTPVYESLPYAYVVGGAMFVAGGIYLGPGVQTAPMYLSLGVISILSGVLIFIKRRQARRDNPRPVYEETTE